jgi:hypothetical protein
MFVRYLTPSILATPIRLAWLRLIIAPIRTLYVRFKDVEDSAVYAAKHSGIKIYLEKALNDKFDPINRAIYINNVGNHSRQYLYRKGEPRAKRFIYKKGEVNFMLYPEKQTFIKRKSEYFGDNDFVVMIPSALAPNLGQLNELVISYKPVGKRYTIDTY